MKKKYLISLIIIFLFALFGLKIAGSFIHENIHRLDYKNIEKDSEEICYLTLPKGLFGRVAYYNFYYDKTEENIEIIEQKKKLAEFKAYSIEIVLIIIFFISLYYSLQFVKKTKNNSNIYKD